MAKAGRVYHWKHGWIPISPEARAFASGKGPRPVTTDLHPPAEALKRAKARQAAYKAAQAKIKTPADIHTQLRTDYRLTTVDGYPEVYFKELREVDKRPPEQYREVAKVITDVLKPYPRATEGKPVEVGWSDELQDDVMADTNAFPPHKIRLQPHMWDKPTMTTWQFHDMARRHFGVTAEAPDLETFRANVITHEIGHLLHMRDEDENKNNGEFTLTTISKGEIDKFADEPVKPRDFGFTDVDPPVNGPYTLDEPTARWQIDSLNHQSVYALSNKYEFFAEAFTDGTINGDKASDTGKRAVALAGKIFGPGSPSLRDRLYGNGAS